jgi:hypothetical protein
VRCSASSRRSSPATPPSKSGESPILTADEYGSGAHVIPLHATATSTAGSVAIGVALEARWAIPPDCDPVRDA